MTDFCIQLTAVPCSRSGTGLAEGETGQAEPDWPALVDWFFDANKLALFAPKIEILTRSIVRMT
ncbi:hypothetical protein [Mesotoga sp. UBA6090]|uniref:hypothetical protein n=1 Tax=Mesotoga sp. UBA6090 TaxID=1946860 RepID=UPI0025FC5B81|nr:hypothetical protein [Mesotoga sp. UBA6090]